MTPTSTNVLNPVDYAVLRIINTGPVTAKYIQRMLRLQHPPTPSIIRLRSLGYLKPHELDTVGFYLTADGHRALLRSGTIL